MVYIKLNAENGIDNIHYMPFDEKYGLGKTEAELLETGLLVDTAPEVHVVDGKIGTPYYNPITKEFYYEYQDIELTQEEKQAQKINDLEGAIMELTMILSMTGGM